MIDVCYILAVGRQTSQSNFFIYSSWLIQFQHSDVVSQSSRFVVILVIDDSFNSKILLCSSCT